MQSEMKVFNGNPSSHGRARLKGVAKVTCEQIKRRGARTQHILKMESDSREYVAVLTLEGKGFDTTRQYLIPPQGKVELPLAEHQTVTRVYGRHQILQ